MRVPSPCAANGAALGNRTPCTASWRQRVAVCSVGCLCDQGSGDGQSVRLLRGRRSRQHTCSEASSANTALGDKWGSRWATETGSCLWRRLGLSTSIYPGVVWWWWCGGVVVAVVLRPASCDSTLCLAPIPVQDTRHAEGVIGAGRGGQVGISRAFVRSGCGRQNSPCSVGGVGGCE